MILQFRHLQLRSLKIGARVAIATACFLLNACSEVEEVAGTTTTTATTTATTTTRTCTASPQIKSYTEDFEDAFIDHDKIPPTLFSRGVPNTVNTNADFENHLDAIEVITDPSIARLGNQLIKFTVYADDFVSGGNRSELSFLKQMNPECSEEYIAWSFMLDTNFEETGDFHTIGQWHAQPLEGEGFADLISPNPIFQEYKQGELRLLYRQLPDFKAVTMATKIIPRGKWVDVIYHVKWSLYNDGYFEGWYRVVDDINDPGTYERLTHLNPASGDYKHYGPTIINSTNNYFKIGLYRSSNPNSTGRTTGVIYYDEIRLGASFDEVAIQ